MTATTKTAPVAKKMTKAKVEEFYKILSEAAPEPVTELHYHDAFTLLVAVVLSAQATDIGVNKATDKLFPVASTPDAILALGEKKLGDYIKTIGLWRTKAKNVIALCHMLNDDYGGKVPDDRDALERLPGVGRKTANVVCNVVFGQPTIAVDTHIFRIGNRTGMAPGKTPLIVEKGLEKITPEAYMQYAHHWLILHGRYICKARTPECYRCHVTDVCGFKTKTPPPGSAQAKALSKKKNAKKTIDKKSTSKKTATKKSMIKPSKKKRAMASKPKLRVAKNSKPA